MSDEEYEGAKADSNKAKQEAKQEEQKEKFRLRHKMEGNRRKNHIYP